MLYGLLALMTLATLALLLWPLLRQAPPVQGRIDYDLIVYRQQLTELERDIEAGLIGPDQADAARTEIQRRMLAAEDLDSLAARDDSGSGRGRIAALILTAVILPIGAAGLYLFLGSPAMPDAPYAWRLAHDPNLGITTAADQLARALQDAPSISGYRRLASLYYRAGDFEKAANASHHALDLGANDAATWSEFGEALSMQAGGNVVPEAMIAFANALERDPKDARARFYLGLAEAQIGSYRQAVAIWKDLAASGKPGDKWLPMVGEHIRMFAQHGRFDPASVPAAPPSPQAMRKAVIAMRGAAPPAPPPPVDVKIRAMVEQLAQRLNSAPNDADGWQRLAHSYVVLGEPAKALAAARHAATLKPNDVSILLTLAEAQKQGHDDDALPADFVATLRQVLLLDGENVEALFYVGIAEDKAGRTANARALWQKALIHAVPGDPVADDIRQRLK